MHRRKNYPLLFLIPIFIGIHFTSVLGEDSVVTETSFSLETNEATCLGSNLADLTADAMYWYSSTHDLYKKANFSLVSEKVFTGSIPSGTITEEDIRNAYRSDAVMIQVKTAGGQLLRAIDGSAKNVPNPDESFVTPGNLTYTIDPRQPGIPERVRYSEDTSRILSLVMGRRSEIGWIDNYRVVCDPNLIEAFPNLIESGVVEVTQEDAIPIADIVIDYIRNNLDGTIPEKYADPKGDHRIRVITDSKLEYDPENESYTYELNIDELKEDTIYWLAIPEELLSRKHQGIIGNAFYQRSFLAQFEGQDTKTECDETIYNVLVPVTNKTGTFILSYGNAPGSKSNNIAVIFTASLLVLILVVITLLSRQNLSVLREKYKK